MSIKIHHGPPGSYKTSGAVMDDFVEAVFAGRVVITNVRGLNDEQRVREVLVDAFPRRVIPDTFELVWIDTDTEDGIFLIQSFWTPLQKPSVYKTKNSMYCKCIANIV